MISENALRWLRLIDDADGWLSEDESDHCGARPGEPAIARIPWTYRRHLIKVGLVVETVYSDGSWRLDVTRLGRIVRRDPAAAFAAAPKDRRGLRLVR